MAKTGEPQEKTRVSYEDSLYTVRSGLAFIFGRMWEESPAQFLNIAAQKTTGHALAMPVAATVHMDLLDGWAETNQEGQISPGAATHLRQALALLDAPLRAHFAATQQSAADEYTERPIKNHHLAWIAFLDHFHINVT